MITPYGGVLCELLAKEGRVADLKMESLSFDSIDLSSRQICDLELLLNGGFSPLQGFMTQEDYESVLDQNRLKNGMVWPLPITLDISEEKAKSISIHDRISLRDQEGCLLAILSVEEIWEIDKKREAQELFGTIDEAHRGVKSLYQKTNTHYIGGKLEGIQLPVHYDYKMLRLPPAEVRIKFKQLGWRRVVAFQTNTPLHRAEQEMTLNAIKSLDANLLLHPAVGLTKPADKDFHARIRCFIEIEKKYPSNRIMLSLLPFATKNGGQKEDLLQGIIRRNYGCCYYMSISGGRKSDSFSFVQSDNSNNNLSELFDQYENEVGIKKIPAKEMLYVEDKAQYLPIEEIVQGEKTRQVSDKELRRRLVEGLQISEWFSPSEVIRELRELYRSKDKQGITIFFTGLSGAGKSTIANVLLVKLLEMRGRPVTLLDGDIVRKNLSSELGFSKGHRDINVKRIGFVASEITKNGGIAICAPIAPYKNTREYNRALISRYGKYVEVHVSTPLEVCEKRDRKGLYAKAKAGLIKGFTGIDDPYELPESPELKLDTSALSPEEAAQEVLLYLENNGYIK